MPWKYRGKLKPGQKTPEAAWRFLHSSERLRSVLYAQWKRSGMRIVDLADAAGIADPKRIYAYFSKAPKSKPNEYQIVRLCEVLKVEIDLDIKIVE